MIVDILNFHQPFLTLSHHYLYFITLSISLQLPFTFSGKLFFISQNMSSSIASAANQQQRPKTSTGAMTGAGDSSRFSIAATDGGENSIPRSRSSMAYDSSMREPMSSMISDRIRQSSVANYSPKKSTNSKASDMSKEDLILQNDFLKDLGK